MKQPNKKLVLDNGQTFYGYGSGADCRKVGEIIFNTSVVGYQEIISDPSYAGQIIVMTYPLIGSYGITDEDFESRQLTIGGLVVREICDTPSNFRYTKTLPEELEDNHTPCISGVDTRMITRILREGNVRKAAIVEAEMPDDEALKLIAGSPDESMVPKVSCKKRWFSRTPNHTFDVVAIDCGIKYNTIRELNRRGCNVTIMPYNASVESVSAFNPDGIFISNGPGNPEGLESVSEIINAFKGKVPVFGLGLGHLLIGQSYGLQFRRLACGIHGDHPVRNLETGKLEVAVLNQNHEIVPETLEGTPLKVTHVTVPEGMVEAYECREDKVYSAQYHAEAAPGPQDSTYLFDKFIKMMEDRQNA